jgi:UTP:GlnB (protein PII) uridylyltransferase
MAFLNTSQQQQPTTTTGNLAHGSAVFPKFQADPSRNTKNLQEAVIEQLCDAVTVEMVGAHYSTTPSGRILNHLYKPVYDSVRSHLARMPRRYALSASPVEVASDLRLLSEVTRDPTSVAVHVDRNEAEGDEHTVTVVAKDKKSLLDTITRTLSSRANITNAEITTTVDGFVLDRFVCQQDESSMALSATDIRAEIEHYLFESLSPHSPVMYAKDGSVVAVPGE